MTASGESDEPQLDRLIQDATEGWRLPSAPVTWTAPSGNVGVRNPVTRGLGAAVAVIAVMAVIALIAGLLSLRPDGAVSSTNSTPSQTPTPPIEAPLDRSRNDLFELSIASNKGRYIENEPIAITTHLRYIAGARETTVTGSGGGLVAFSVEQLDGPIDALAGRDEDCTRYKFQIGDNEEIALQKSASWSSDDPRAQFWRAWVDDPLLRLPGGTYRITAELEYGPPECGEPERVTASIEIVVGVVTAATAPPTSLEPPGPTGSPNVPGTPSPEPTPITTIFPPSDHASDHQFRLSIASDRAQYTTSEAISVTTTLTHLGAAPVRASRMVLTHLEQLDGPVDLAAAYFPVCLVEPIAAHERQQFPYGKSGIGIDDEDPMVEFWRRFARDPELHLPAGHYRFTSILTYAMDDCGSDHTLSVATEIYVVDAEPRPSGGAP